MTQKNETCILAASLFRCHVSHRTTRSLWTAVSINDSILPSITTVVGDTVGGDIWTAKTGERTRQIIPVG